MSQSNEHASGAAPILAAPKDDFIQAEAVKVDWVEAAASDGETPKPKRFAILAYTGGAMRVSRYDPPVVVDLAGMRVDAPVPTLLAHDHAAIVGHADEVEKLQSALKLRGVVSGAGDAAQEVLATAANGFPWRASIGAQPLELEWIPDGTKTTANGKTFSGPLYVARKSELKEVSFVAVAADGRTSVKVAASAAQYKESNMDFAQWIQALGFTPETLTDQQKVALQAKYDAEVAAAAKNAENSGGAAGGNASNGSGGKTNPPEISLPEFDADDIKAAFSEHLINIEAEVAGYEDKIDADPLRDIRAEAVSIARTMKAKALKERWPTVKVEAEMIRAMADLQVKLVRAERPKAPAAHINKRDFCVPAIEAAFSRTCGLHEVEKHFDEKTLEASDRYRGIGLQELLILFAGQGGYHGRPRVGNDNLREVLAAAFSTHTITTLLSGTANKILLEGFNVLPQTWRQVARTRNVTDFKAVTAYRLTGSLEYEEVGPAGEIAHGSVGQESYSMQAKTYAKLLGLTRADIINDDLNAFDDLRTRLAVGWAVTMNNKFWTMWLAAVAAGTFWTAARGNLVTDAALGEAGLNKAVKAFRDMKGTDGNRLSLNPKYILVPSDLEATALKWYNSMEMRDTTSSTRTATANIYYKRFEPIVVPELGDSSYTGYSATNYWLLADPAILASAVMCFLNGVETPTIESTDADFDTLGILFRGYHDFGPSMSEYRASIEAQASA